MEQVIQALLQLGLPVLGTALGGPLGGTVAGMIARALGAPSSSAGDLLASLQSTDKDVAIQKLKSAEAEYVAAVQSEASIQTVQLREIGQTMRTELGVDVGEGRFGRIVRAMQISWRPAMAWQTIIECTAGGILAIHELWTGDIVTVDMILKFQTFLIWYFSAKFALVGVYVAGRSFEKPVDANVAPSWVKTIIDAVKSKK